MAVEIRRLTLDFVVHDYAGKTHRIEAVDATGSAAPMPWKKGKICTMRWYLSLQGECAPLAADIPQSPLPSPALPDTLVYRYDWAFGITLLEGFYWDWMEELPENGALAIHVAVLPHPLETGPELIPTGAVLSTLHPSRNTRTLWEQALPLVPRLAAEAAKTGSLALPALNYLSPGLTAGSDLLASYTGNKKNWFLYQFVDEKLRCPVVEWRINKTVLREYGPLLRGSLALSIARPMAEPAGSVRILLRPQIRYDLHDELNYIVPTRTRAPEEEVFLDIQLG